MENNTIYGLLPKLCQLTGCPYLSDLHNLYYAKNVLGALYVINTSLYSLEQWKEAYRYITGHKEAIGTETEIIRELIQYLKDKINEE